MSHVTCFSTIILYRTPTCPKCKILEEKLTEKNIRFEESTNVEEMKAMGISSVPVLFVDGKLMSFVEANKWINEQPSR